MTMAPAFRRKTAKMCSPFYRLDDARTAQMGGTGLGLAIARDIARGHGGDITLDQSNLGGLQARISIPA